MSDLQIQLKLYGITDRAWLNGRSMASVVEEAIKGGVTMIQYREKNLDRESMLTEASEVLNVCRKYNVPFIINDDPYLAKELSADGVHLGQGDMPIKEAREILGNNSIIGITAKTVIQATEAQRDGADYLGSGAMFGSTTKTDAKKLSVSELKAITESVSIPVVAIGGINIDNVTELKGTGIAGVAVVSGIFASKDIKEDTKNLLQKVSSVTE